MLFAASALFNVALGTEEHGCLRVVGLDFFTEEYLSSLCPETDYRTDKTINARICPGSNDPLTGKPYDMFEDTKAAREFSLKLAILNQMYSDSDHPASCDYYCMYDPLNVGPENRLAFIYRDGEDKECWDLVNNWSCFDHGYDEYLHAQDKVSRMCSMDSLTPPTELEAPSCIRKVPVEMYTKEYLSMLCPEGKSGATGNTYKDYENAVICPDSIDPTTGQVWHSTYENQVARERGLALTLVNQMYGTCASHCMYDTEHLGPEGGVDTLIAYVWKGGDKQCWHLVNAFGCISGNGEGEYKAAVAKAQNFCHPKSADVPTFSELLARLEIVVDTLRELDAEVGIVPQDDASIEELLKFVTEAERRLLHLKERISVETL